MGGSCFRPSDQQGDLLPGDSQGEISERQEAVRRQEREIALKREQFTALNTALETDRRKNVNLRKELKDLYAENEDFKAKIATLNEFLKNNEAEIANFEKNKSENEQLTTTIRQFSASQDFSTLEIEESRLQSEISSESLQIPALEREIERLKSEIDAIQTRFRETEGMTAVLESSEVAKEQNLGEELSLFENNKRKYALKIANWINLRKTKGIQVKFVRKWREIGREIEGKTQELEIERKINEIALPDIRKIEQILAEIQEKISKNREIMEKSEEIFRPLTGLTSEMSKFLMLIAEKAESLSEEFSDEEEILRSAAEIEVLKEKKDLIQTLLSAVENAQNWINLVDKITEEGEKLSSQTQNTLKTQEEDTNSALKLISDAENELRTTANERISREKRTKIEEMMRKIAEKNQICEKNNEKIGELSEIFPVFTQIISNLLNLKQKCPKNSSQLLLISSNLSDLLSKSTQIPPELHSKSPILERIPTEEMSEEVAIDAQPVEMEVAAGNEEQVPNFTVDWSGFGDVEREEIEENWSLMQLQEGNLQEMRTMTEEELWTQIRGFFSANSSIFLSSPTCPALFPLISSHFPSDTFLPFALNLENTALTSAPDSYISLLSSAFHCNRSFPVPDSQAKLTLLSEAQITDFAANFEKNRKNRTFSSTELMDFGGKLYLTDAFTAIYELFPPDSASKMCEIALENLQPASISLPNYLNFLVCYRLKSLKMDSLKLFKSIDDDNSGKLNGEEFSHGINDKLSLCMRVNHIKQLFMSLDADGSDSISKIEFTRAINLKEYYQKCESEDYAVTRKEFIRAVLEPLRVWREKVTLKLERAVQGMTLEGGMLGKEEVERVLREVEGVFGDDYVQVAGSSAPMTPRELLRFVQTRPPGGYSALARLHAP